MSKRRISGRTAVISGAASGIGRALAQRLSTHCCPVALTDVDELGAVLRDLVHDPGLARSVGTEARRAALARYGLARFLDDWDQLLAKVA